MKITCPRCKTDYDIQDPQESTKVVCEECHLEFQVESPKLAMNIPEPLKNPDQQPLPSKTAKPQSNTSKSSTIQKVEITHLVNVTVKDLDISMGQMIWLTVKAIPAIFIGVLLFWLCVAIIGGIFGISLFG
jgi:hypothetical protein